MTALEIGIASFPILMTLIFLRVPIGLAMFLVGLGGLMIVTDGTQVAFGRLKSETYSTFSSYSLTIVPMFLLMGHFATLGGMSSALFKAAEGFLGHRKGGVAMAAIGACAGFGAICGSSLATAATMGKATGKDADMGKQTLVTSLGVEGARRHLNDTVATALSALRTFGPRADGLRATARYFASREN